MMLQSPHGIRAALIVAILFCGSLFGCSRTQEPSASKPRDTIQQQMSPLLNDTAQQRAAFAPSDPGLYVGIVSHDHLLLPIAHQRSDGEWQYAWTNMWSSEQAPPRMRTDIPHQWILSSLDTPPAKKEVVTTHGTMTEFGCESNWALVLPGYSSAGHAQASWGEELAVAFNMPVTTLSMEEYAVWRPRIEKAKRGLDYVDHPVENEMRNVYKDLMFFHWQNGVVGIICLRGWENTVYLLIRIDGDRAEEVLRIPAGGC